DMKKASAFVLISSFLLLVLASACNTSVDDMLDDYNDGFNLGYTTVSDTKEEEEVILQPGEEGFDPASMLRDEYFLGWDATLNLYAPETADRFQWFLTDPDDIEENLIEFCPCNSPYNGDYVVTEVTSRMLSIYAEDSRLDNGTTYKLTLNVWKGGKKYTDICSLVVYQHYYFAN
ncbi:MAG: hypothetical protein IJ207_04525, partial [Treponema sp.]|uniref:hypothetical protein n=1 Tax=Treponema sp. TaxID=166 RepID=UPI0025E87EF7